MTDISFRPSRELFTDSTPEDYPQPEMDSSDSDSDFEVLDDLSSLCLSDAEPGDEPRVGNRSYLRGIVDMGRQVTFHFYVPRVEQTAYLKRQCT